MYQSHPDQAFQAQQARPLHKEPTQLRPAPRHIIVIQDIPCNIWLHTLENVRPLLSAVRQQQGCAHTLPAQQRVWRERGKDGLVENVVSGLEHNQARLAEVEIICRNKERVHVFTVCGVF